MTDAKANDNDYRRSYFIKWARSDAFDLNRHARLVIGSQGV